MRRFYVLALMTLPLTINAQQSSKGSNCTQVLRLARATYEQGRLHEVPSLLVNCLQNTGPDGLTKEERRDAYKLLTQTYIYLEEPELADVNMLSLLQTDHFFQVDQEVDPAEFIALYKKFRTDELFRIGVRVGVNTTLPQLKENVYVGGASAGNGKYALRPGFQFGVSFEKDILKKKFILAPELFFTSRGFTYRNESVFIQDQTGNPITTIESRYSQSWIDLNAMVHYKLKEIKNTSLIYVTLGPGVSYFLSGKNQTTLTHTTGEGAVSGPDVDLQNTYEKFVYSIHAGVGGRIRFGALYVMADLRYQQGLTSPFNGKTNSEALFDYGLQNNRLNMGNIILNVGVVIPVFKPEKLIK